MNPRIMKLWILGVIIGIILYGDLPIVRAHEAHKQTKKETLNQNEDEQHELHENMSTESVSKRTTAISTTGIGSETVKSAPSMHTISDFMPHAMMEHNHNKIVHLPIGFGIAGILMIFLSFKWPQLKPAISVLLFGAAICAIVAYFTGRWQKEPFEQNEFKNIVWWHEKLGITTAAFLWIGAVLSIYPKADKWMWVYAIILVLIISATGFLGGILATS